MLEGCYEVSLEPSLTQSEEPHLSQPFILGVVLQSFTVSAVVNRKAKKCPFQLCLLYHLVGQEELEQLLAVSQWYYVCFLPVC